MLSKLQLKRRLEMIILRDMERLKKQRRKRYGVGSEKVISSLERKFRMYLYLSKVEKITRRDLEKKFNSYVG